MRTLLNIRVGGRTGLSGVIHSILLTVVLLALSKYASLIPLFVLAGILVSVGIGIRVISTPKPKPSEFRTQSYGKKNTQDYPPCRIRIKRVYEPAEPEDGVRFLVDRLGPRGLSKEKASLNEWLKEIAPSTELRKWFNHEPDLWREFQQRYRAELKHHQAKLNYIRDLAKTQTVTLVYSAQDHDHNSAVVLRAPLLKDQEKA